MATIAMLPLPKQSQHGNGCHVVSVWARALQGLGFRLSALGFRLWVLGFGL